MGSVQVTVAPETGVVVSAPPNVGTFFIDAVYTRAINGQASTGVADLPNTVQETVRVTLDQSLHGTFNLADIAPSTPIELRFLGPTGSVRLAKNILSPNGATLAITLSAEDVQAIVTPDPQPATSTPQIDRRAYFVPVGDQPVPFDVSKLQVAPVKVGSGGWRKLGLDQVFHADTPITSAVAWDTALAAGLASIPWTSFHLAIDGQFSFSVPQGSGDAWMWWLSGPMSAIGVVLDDLSSIRVTGIAVALPPFSGILTSDDGLPRVPTDFTEEEVAANPQVYTEDPGQFCKPFKNPERVLGERSFFTILRAEQPVVSAQGSAQIDPLPVLTYNPVATLAAGVTTPTPTVGPSPVTQPVRLPGGTLVDDAANVTFVRHTLPAPYVDVLRRVNRGRATLDADNPVQWEADVSRYQATTVARGHILELRMRWRSNGYSLGTVAKTMTLAPRQTKRIQKIEWSRSEFARRAETTQLLDQVADTVSRDRSYDDAVQANLSEWARGQSESSMAAAAGGFGFAAAGFVIGGGGGGSNASSSSSQEGGRRTSASEDQHLRDSIRRYGDSLRKLDSMVVSEVTQEETATGTTEIIRNANYGHSLTVIYYQILRHLKIDTEVAGVRECLFVPFAITPFTVPRAYRWREFIQKGMRDPQFAGAVKYLKDVLTNFANSDIPPGRRSDQPVRFIFGSLFIKLAVERPRDKDDGSFDSTKWTVVQPYLGSPVLGIVNTLKAMDDTQRDAIFQKQYAAVIATNWVETLQLDLGGPALPALFTLASRYQFNNAVRVDFTIPVPAGQTVTRETLSSIHVTATKGLPPGSVANLQSLTFTYQTDTFQRSVTTAEGSEHLIQVDTGVPDLGATISTIPDEWERRDVRAEITSAVQGLIEHLNEHVEYYHKFIWWNMDRDRLFMLIDGFYMPGTNQVSIASVAERDPIAIIGNAIVFRVSSGSFLGIGNITTPGELFNYYVSMEAPSEPMLISLPTDGLYAQTVMDECAALEEHFGNTDWVLNDPDPALGEIAPELLLTRRAEPQSTQPAPLPATLINLQNAPEAPAPSGLAGALAAVTTPNAFRDMTGLAGTQANAATAFQAAAQLATNFGNQAAALKMAQLAKDAHSTQTADQKLATVQRAVNKGLVPSNVAQNHASKILDSLHASDSTAPENQREAAVTQAVLAAADSGDQFTVQHATADGTTSVSVTKSGGSKSAAVSPFPAAAFPDPLTATDPKLTTAFQGAIAAVKADATYSALPNVDDLPIIIVALNDDGTRPFAGAHVKDMFFSGSLLKIAAMYAAFQLRHAVNAFALTLNPATVTDQNAFFRAIHSAFDNKILSGAPDLIKSSSTEGKRVPRYEDIFDASQDASGVWSVHFHPDTDPQHDFDGHLSKMIVDSHNPSAGYVIQKLGFSLIDGLLQKAGLFRPSPNPNGIWLAGDYLEMQSVIIAEHAKQVAHDADPTNPAKPPGDPDSVESFNLGIFGWATVDIPSVNDGKVKQVTTCIDAARLFVLLFDSKLIDNNLGSSMDLGNGDMANLLGLAAESGGATSLIGSVDPTGFSITWSKIGVGDLKPVNGGQKVFSEAMLVHQTADPQRNFVVVWQNVKAATNNDLRRIRDIIQKTMDDYNP